MASHTKKHAFGDAEDHDFSAFPASDEVLAISSGGGPVATGVSTANLAGAAADMDEDRIKGRAAGSGTGPAQNLTPAQVRTIVGPATEPTAGVIELATQPEADAGVDDARAMTPAKALARKALYRDFDIAVGVPANIEGRMGWDPAAKAPSYRTGEGTVAITVGQESTIRVRNNTGALIPGGSGVYFSGSDGVYPEVDLAVGSDLIKRDALGVVTQDIANGDTGLVTTQGVLNDLDTSAWAVGDGLWLHETTPGALTNVRPSSSVFLGRVVVSHATAGAILVTREFHPQPTVLVASNISDTNENAVTRRDVVSSRRDRLVGVTVNSGSPQSHLVAGFSQVLVNVLTLTATGTLRLTGTSYDPFTQVQTPGDTEDLVVNSVGWYEFQKEWVGTVVLSAPGSLNVTLDSYLWAPFLFHRDYRLLTVRGSYVTTSTTNRSEIVIQKFVPLTGFVPIVSQAHVNFPSGALLTHHFELFTEVREVSLGERLWAYVDVQRLKNMRFWVQGE